MVSRAGVGRRWPGRVIEVLRGALSGRCGSGNKPNMLLVVVSISGLEALTMNTTTIFTTAARPKHPAVATGTSFGDNWFHRCCDRVAVRG
jgi:hypothetical protein